jgi:hypothetical protein
LSEKVVRIGGGITLTVSRLNPKVVTVGVVKADWDNDRQELFHWIFNIDLPQDKMEEIVKTLNEV